MEYIAVDLGAESGRVMLGAVQNGILGMLEVHRFENAPIREDGALKWDFRNILSEVKKGISAAVRKSEGKVSGIGVDSWGVDYGLLGSDGELLENPYHYRDERNKEMMQRAFELLGKEEIYANTGLQFMQINTIYQLLSSRINNPELLGKAEKLVFIADLLCYYLSGRISAEYSLASTSQLMDMHNGKWSEIIFGRLGLPIEIMPEVVKPGTISGPLRNDLCEEFGCEPINVIASASHDTACAVAAVPAEAEENWAYLSSGTWSLIGIESAEAYIGEKSLKYSFTNEGGVEGTIRFLKNITGLWILQECRRQWQAEGEERSYGQLADMARRAEAFFGYIDTDDKSFLSPGNMPEKINNFLSGTGQQRLNDKGQTARVILESLAFKYRKVIDDIFEITGKNTDVLHIVGGGIKNTALCEFTADALGKKVITGPAEATAAGNILMQARATGQIKSLRELRQIVKNSFRLKEYLPVDGDNWERQYNKIKDLK